MNETNDKKIAVIGGGSMGCAFVRGLIANGYDPCNISVGTPHPEKISELAGKGVSVSSSNIETIKDASYVIVAVKPWILPVVAAELRNALDVNRQRLALIVAGIPCSELRDMWKSESGNLPNMSLVMPNTAMEVGRSMTFVVEINGDAIAVASLFENTGKVMRIEERQLGAATALASCGIAYAMRYVRAAVEGGVELGFRAAEAQAIVAETLAGTAMLLERPHAHAEVEIDRVTTPGGLTIRGLNAMEANGFTTAVIAGLRASIPRS